MSVAQIIRSSLGHRMALAITALLVVLTGAAGAYIAVHETRMMEQFTLDKARLAATLGARQYGDTFEAAIDSGLLTVNDVFDKNYVEIKGYNWGDKPRYHTRYDFVTDRAVLIFEDKFLQYEDFVFAVGVDENGYLPTHNTKYQHPLTGDLAKDLVGNRSKRIFNDPVGLAAGRNCSVGGPCEASLQQVYKRDTGEIMWDVSSPIYVKGKHWGGFRVAVSMEKIAEKQRALTLSLITIFVVFVLVTGLTMFVMVRRSMKPVEQLTKLAGELSLGESLEQPIKSDSVDEIGRLTKALDRLRVSMKAALSRLGE
jgi:HAMP domain-containing protein